MKFTICDDTAIDLDNLEKIISNYCKVNNLSYKIEKYNNPDALIKRVAFDPNDYQVFFLDVVMQSSGIELASQIRKYREDAIIVFTTSSKDFALDAFGVRAYDYLLKPLDPSNTNKCITRIFNDIQNTPVALCKIKTTDHSLTTVNIKDIAYIESINRRIVIHKKNNEEITSTTLHSKFLESIPFDYEKANFINCHASYVVNMNYVKSITDKSFIMKNDEVIPISKNLLSLVKKNYIKYLVGE